MFIFTFYLAKILGSVDYGKYDYSLSFGFLVGVFFELGGNIILTKYIARGHFSAFGYSLKFRIISILLTFLVVFFILITFKLHTDILSHILFAMMGISFSSLMNLYFAFFRGVRKMNYEAIVLVLQKIIYILLCFALFTFKMDSASVLLSFAVSMFICWQIIQIIFLKQKHRYTNSNETEEIKFRAYFKDIMSLALVEVFSVIYFRATQIILEQFGSFSEVGKYGVSYKLVEAFTNIPAILMIVLFPNFAKLAKENLFEYKSNFKKVLIIFLILGFISCLLTWTFGEPFFKLIGKDYDQSYIIVRYMSLAMFMIFPNYLTTQSLIAIDKNLTYAYIVFIALIINVIIAAALVPFLGAIGSAISVGICELLIFVLTIYNLFKYLNKSVSGKTSNLI